MQTFNITPTQKGTRLDVFVQQQIPLLSRSSVYRLVEDHKITVNDKNVKAGYKLKQHDVVQVDFNNKDLQIPVITLPILYEDKDCLVINKPSGILTHSKGAFNPEATVASFIAPMTKNMSGDRAGIVHRLDRATSGVIICAKTPEALSWLQKQFSQRKSKKEYVAIIKGMLDPASALIDMPIARNAKAPKTFHVNSHGKSAQTIYSVTEQKNGYSLLKLHPQTGRTHQLRVHLKHLGHPIVGDTMYEGEPSERLMLHAHKLEITLPNRERHEFVAPLPDAFHTIMNG